MPNYRLRLVHAALGAIHAAAHFRYEEIRPIPYSAFVHLMESGEGEVVTDCSGLVTCCFFRAGLPDPNNLKYDGEGYTGTLLHGTLPVRRRREDTQPGDPCVLGAYPGRHVVIPIEGGWNPLCVSHGKPGDPHIAPLEDFLGLGPLTILNARPNVLHRRRRRKFKWIVSGDEGQVISHATGILRWVVRHPRTYRKQRNQLHFDRIPRHHVAGTTNPPIS